MSQKLKSILVTAIGVLAIILSISCYKMDVGSYERDMTYGGDAYTGIQNAAAQTARNVQETAKIVRFGLGSVLLVSGLLITVEGVSGLNVSDIPLEDVKKLLAKIQTTAGSGTENTGANETEE